MARRQDKRLLAAAPIIAAGIIIGGLGPESQAEAGEPYTCGTLKCWARPSGSPDHSHAGDDDDPPWGNPSEWEQLEHGHETTVYGYFHPEHKQEWLEDLGDGEENPHPMDPGCTGGGN